MADVLATWIYDPRQPNSGVNYVPLLRGQWEDQFWKDDQVARASNNRAIQSPIGSMNAIRWEVESTVDDPNVISFNVSIDLPGQDPIAWRSQANNSVVALPRNPQGLLLATDNVLLADANERGFYIATPEHATAPFTVRALSAKQ